MEAVIERASDFIVIIYYLLILITVFNLFVYLKHLWSLSSYPPGPFPLPLIGNLHIMDEFTSKFEEKYGGVYSFSFGMERVVMVNKIEPAREAMITKAGDFAGRPTNNYPFNVMTKNMDDINMRDYGLEWAGRRKLTATGLKKLCGANNSKLEEIITLEAREMNERFVKKMANPIEIRQEFKLVICNVIITLLFGERFNDLEDGNFLKIIRALDCVEKALVHGDAVNVIPLLRYLPITCMRMAREHRQLVDEYFDECYGPQKKNLDPNNINCLLSFLIYASMDDSLLHQHGLKGLSRDTISGIIEDLVVTAVDTTTIDVSFLVLRMLHYPKYVSEALQEIQSVVGINQYPELKHRSSLHKVMAIIQESMRLTSGPFPLQHKAMKDGTIGGHPVPKGTQVLFNQYRIHRDDRHWEDPEEYKPYRWLDDDGKYNPTKHKSFVPFLLGKRSCIGEFIARSEIFLLFTRLIVDFKIESDPSQRIPKTTEGTCGISYYPPIFKVLLKKKMI